MPTINIIATDGVAIAKTTSITDSQAAQFIALSSAIREARETRRTEEGQQNVIHTSGDPGEVHPLTIRQLLPRLDEILDQPSGYGHVSNRTGEGYLRLINDPGIDLHTGNHINPAAPSLRKSIAADGDYLGVARTLGMLLANENEPYAYVELLNGPTACQLRWR